MPAKIMPDQDAALITNIVKRVVFVDVPAPAPHDIAVRLAEQRKRLFIPLRVPAVERVQRHPVRTLAKDRHAVCQHLEFSVVTRHKIRLYFECTDPQVQLPHVLAPLRGAAAPPAFGKGWPGRSLWATTASAPAPRSSVRQSRTSRVPFRRKELSRTRAAHPHRKPLQHRVFRCKTELQQYLRTFPVRAQRCHVHFFKICVPLWADGNAPPQPGGHQSAARYPSRTYGPACAHRSSRPCAPTPGRARPWGTPYSGRRSPWSGCARQPHFHPPARSCDVEPVFQHHIVRLAHCRPVQIHRRKGVHAVQAQHRAAVRQRPAAAKNVRVYHHS